MKLERSKAVVTVRLSRRNLVALLHKIDEMEDSARSLVRCTPDGLLTVIAETDDAHYEARIPGRMHPLTERYIRDHTGRAF